MPRPERREHVTQPPERSALRAAIQAANPVEKASTDGLVITIPREARSPADILRERMARKAAQASPAPTPPPRAENEPRERAKERESEPRSSTGEVSHDELLRVLNGGEHDK